MTMVGTLLQMLVVSVGLVVSYLLSRKGYEKWGYIVGFFGVFTWGVEEAYFRQWFLFLLNPIYLWLYLRGWSNHRGK